MSSMSRRSVLGTTLGLAAAGTLGRPLYRQRPSQDRHCLGEPRLHSPGGCGLQQAYRRLHEGERQQDRPQHHAVHGDGSEVISALTSGDVPDLIFADAPANILPQNAWDDKIVDVTDVVAPYESQLTETAKAGSTFYNKVTKKRSYYLCPIKQGCVPFHIWGNLVEKAGYKLSDVPNTWDAFWNFFKPMQAKLREAGCASCMLVVFRSPRSARTMATGCSRRS